MEKITLVKRNSTLKKLHDDEASNLEHLVLETSYFLVTLLRRMLAYGAFLCFSPLYDR